MGPREWLLLESAVVGSDERLRVEELARRAEVSVDTIRFYQKRRLLPPPAREGRVAWYGPAHVERLGADPRPPARGASRSRVIRRLLAGELDADRRAARRRGRDGRGRAPEEFLTLDELAERSGVPAAASKRSRSEGLLIPRLHDGEPPLHRRRRRRSLPQGLRLLEARAAAPRAPRARPPPSRRHPRTSPRSAVAMFDDYVRQPLRDSDLPDDERAEQLVAAFRCPAPVGDDAGRAPLPSGPAPGRAGAPRAGGRAGRARRRRGRGAPHARTVWT